MMLLGWKCSPLQIAATLKSTFLNGSMGVAIVPRSLMHSGLKAAFIPLSSGAVSPLQCMWLNGVEQPLVLSLVRYAKAHLQTVAADCEIQSAP